VKAAPSGWRSPWTVLVALAAGAAFGLLLNDGIGLVPEALRGPVLEGLDLIADIFVRLLKMIVAPLVLFSIMAGVTGISSPGRLGRLGLRTFLYYLCTSLLAILTGLVLVNLIRPGKGAELQLPEPRDDLVPEAGNLLDIFRRIVPENVFDALARLDMLQIIFFALLAGFAVTQLPRAQRERLSSALDALFGMMTRLAHIVLGILPIAVAALLARIVARSDGSEFVALLKYFLTVVAALAVHAFITLPLILALVAKVNPLKWVRAVSTALITAFSTSSSSATLPVTLESVEQQGGVRNEISSFVLPLGATINMDGTALYECVATIFIAQFYAGAMGFELGLAQQVIVVLTALLASIGAAGIPSAGLVMMTIILQALQLPVEGALLVLVVDRPLDMLRTATNVWSDTIGTAVLGRTEGMPADP
jgi:Na+/H+-dicarboxylate symporter